MPHTDDTTPTGTLSTGTKFWVGKDPQKLDQTFPTCPRGGTITAFSLALTRRVWIATRCNTWGCEYCGPRKVWSLAFRVTRAKPNKLITLTCRPSLYKTPREAFDMLRRQVSELAKVLRRTTGPFEYMRVLELTQAGWPHFHLVARSPYIPHQLLSHTWARLTNAPVVDIRKIHDPKTTLRYVVKYLAKQTHVDFTRRRIAWTKNFFHKVETEPSEGLNLQQVERSKLHWTVYMTTYLEGECVEQIYGSVFGIADPTIHQQQCPDTA